MRSATGVLHCIRFLALLEVVGGDSEKTAEGSGNNYIAIGTEVFNARRSTYGAKGKKEVSKRLWSSAWSKISDLHCSKCPTMPLPPLFFLVASVY